MTGSFILGFLMRFLLATTASPELRVSLIEDGEISRAVAYVVLSVLLSLLATYAGFAAARAALAPPR